MENSFGLVYVLDEPGWKGGNTAVRMKSEMIRGPNLSFERYMKIW